MPRYSGERFVYDDVRAPLPELRIEVHDWNAALMGTFANVRPQATILRSVFESGCRLVSGLWTY